MYAQNIFMIHQICADLIKLCDINVGLLIIDMVLSRLVNR